MRSLELGVFQLVTHHRQWRSLQQHIAAVEVALETARAVEGGGEGAARAMEALDTVLASLYIDLADLRERLVVIVREASFELSTPGWHNQ